MAIVFLVICILLVATYFLDCVEYAGPVVLCLGGVVVVVSCVEFVAGGQYVFWKTSGVFLAIGIVIFGGPILFQAFREARKKPKDS